MHVFVKTSTETRQMPVSIASELDGQTVTSCSVAITPLGLAAGTSLVAVAQTTPSGASVNLSAGTDGEIYAVTVTISLDDGQDIERHTDVHVNDIDFALVYSDGSSPYQSPADYLDRFDYEELLELAGLDASGTVRLNKKRFIAALADTAAEMDAILTERFQVPISSPPSVLTATAAVLTREKLYSFADNMPEHIEKAASKARATLRSLASGDMALPGLVIRTASVETPTTSPGKPQFSDKQLGGF